ncbi:hypothetical protein AGMMS50218_17590 [Actinomycetota bacterium]|nr:hypothetical protein AGMMS50218_17590 [Actinomycetota bacterium]
MGAVGTSADNAMAESFNATLKREALAGAHGEMNVLFESDDSEYLTDRGMNFPELAEGALDQFSSVASVAKKMAERIREISGPDEITLELSASLSAEVGWFVAKSAAEGSVKVTLTWKTTASG